MNHHGKNIYKQTNSTTGGGGGSQWSIICWLASAATLSFPQAAGPIAFSLLALGLTGNTRDGAAMILAMTLAQVVGVIPITRLGSQLSAAKFLRTLITARSLALVLIALGAWLGIAIDWLIFLSALAGLVNGAAHGYLRVVLNDLVSAEQLPRTLGIAATLNELTFVLAPVAASCVGIISPVFAILVLTVLGAFPAILVPDVCSRHIQNSTTAPIKGAALNPSIALWLACATAGGAAVSVIEIGAVALALNFKYEPALAVLLTVPLCLSSVSGGVWVSVRNRMPSRGAILAQLWVMTLGSTLVALNISLATTVIGAILVGSVVAPLGTYYSLALDALAHPRKKAEIFALLRTANAVGIIFSSAALTMTSLSNALMMVTGIMISVAIGIGVIFIRDRFHHL